MTQPKTQGKFRRGQENESSTETHESNVGKQLREYPNSRARHNDRDDVENQPHDGKTKEQTNQAEDANTQVPDSQPQHDGPEGEHDSSKHDNNH